MTQKEEGRVFPVKYLIWEILDKVPGSHFDGKLELCCRAGKNQLVEPGAVVRCMLYFRVL